MFIIDLELIIDFVLMDLKMNAKNNLLRDCSLRRRVKKTQILLEYFLQRISCT